MKIKLATVNLGVADPERSKRFYTQVLGMVEDEKRSHPPGFVYLKSAGADLTLATPQGASGAEPSHTVELGFEVDDVGGMKAHLSSLGIASYREESMGWGSGLEMRDLDGNRVLVYAFRNREG